MIGSLKQRLKPLVAIGLVSLVVLVAVLLRPTSASYPAFDPNATDPLGYAGLREMLGRYADVSVSSTLPRDNADPSVSAYLVGAAGVTSTQQRRLRQLADAGATVVYSDALLYPPDDSSVAEVESGAFSDSVSLVNTCGESMPSIAHVKNIRAGNARLLLVDQDESPRQGCIQPTQGQAAQPDQDSATKYAFVVARESRRGSIVTLGDGTVWSNGLLGEEDNAALAIALLAPRSGAQVQFVMPDPSTTVDDDQQVYGLGPMLELAPTWTKAVALNLLLAFVVFALARSRRVGRPIEEPFIADVDASEQTQAIANVLRAGRHANQAAKIYRQALRERLIDALQLPSSISTADLCHVAAQRLAIDRSLLDAVLVSRYVADSTELLALSAKVQTIQSRLRSSAQLVQTSKEN